MALGIGLLSTMSIQTSYATAVLYIIITGIGLGVSMPLYVIAIQNAVPYAVMGVATSSTAFFRSIGGALGLAILGSIMNNRFASDFVATLSPRTLDAISPEPLESLVHNPQALVSAEAQSELSAMFQQMGAEGEALFEQVLEALKLALNSAVTQVFFIAMVVVVVGWVANLFLKEIPLRKHH